MVIKPERVHCVMHREPMKKGDDGKAYESPVGNCCKTCFGILMDATIESMTEGAVRRAVGGCRFMVLLIEILHGVGLESRCWNTNYVICGAL